VRVTSDEQAAFRKDGFVIARNLLPALAIEELLASFQKTVQDSLRMLGVAHSRPNLHDALVALHAADLDVYKKVMGCLWRKEVASRTCNSPAILQFLKEKFGWSDVFLPGGQVALIMGDKLRIPNGYFGLIPHQDFPSVQGSLDGVVAWFPLLEVSRKNFPMEVIPGSHHRGVFPTVDRGQSTWEIPSDSYQEEDFVPIEANAGDVVFMSVFTVHRSSLSGEPGAFRIAMSTRFDNGDEPTFIERSFPTAYVRSIERKPYFPGFPDAGQLAKAFS
jgi:hypothetical protein